MVIRHWTTVDGREAVAVEYHADALQCQLIPSFWLLLKLQRGSVWEGLRWRVEQASTGCPATRSEGRRCIVEARYAVGCIRRGALNPNGKTKGPLKLVCIICRSQE